MNPHRARYCCCLACRTVLKAYPDERCPRCDGELVRGGVDLKGNASEAIRARMRELVRERGRVYP